MANILPEYKVITRPGEEYCSIASEDIEIIENGNWEIVFFYVDMIAYVLQLKRG